jgi:SAM-dependent methyltransferase
MIRAIFNKDSRVNIADIGGIGESYSFFKELLPYAAIWTVNHVEEHMKGCKNCVLEDFSEKISLPSGKFDLVFLGDTLEHMADTDTLVEEICRITKCGGFLILTTPNMASWVNRFSLLFGFAPTNYHPSDIRYGAITGANRASYHKSVFTLPALKSFLKQHGFETLKTRGFSYHNMPICRLASLLPKTWQEGIIVLCKKK